MRRICTMIALALCCSFDPGEAAAQEQKAPAAKERRGPKRLAPSKKASGKGVRVMFQEAQKLYDAKDYHRALAAYAVILKKYPGHEPTIIQMAKAYYRIDRLPDAYTLFARLNPQYLDPETSFEYGMSFHNAKQWEGGLYAFKRVTEDHPLFDLANYYGAVSAIKLKRYDEAEEMLEKAVVLPDKLAKSRKLYLKHVQSLRLLQQKSALAEDRQKEKRRLKKGAKDQERPEKSAAKDPNTPYQHAGFKSVKKSAEAKYYTERVEYDFYGRATENYRIDVSTFTFANGPLFDLPIKASKERRAAIGIPFSARGKWAVEDGQEERYIVRESNEEIVEKLLEDKGITDEKLATIQVNPWLEFPLPDGVWLAFGAELELNYPEFEAGGRYGSRKGYGELNGRVDAYVFKGQLGYTDFFDAKSESEYVKTNTEIGLTLELPEAFEVSGTFKYDRFEYIKEEIEIDGPDSTTAFVLGLGKGLPFFLKVSTELTYAAQTNFLIHEIPSFNRLSADASVASARFEIAFAPWKFLALKASGLIQQTDWQVARPEAKETFEANVANVTSQAWASVALGLDF